MFAHHQTIQLHHVDSYGIIFFPHQLAFCHDAFQAWLAHHGRPLAPTRAEAEYVAVMVHAESDYAAPVRLGDRLTIEYSVAAVGRTSFTNAFRLCNQHGVAVGGARTVQVTVEPRSSLKMPIPGWLRRLLEAERGEAFVGGEVGGA